MASTSIDGRDASRSFWGFSYMVTEFEIHDHEFRDHQLSNSIETIADVFLSYFVILNYI